MDLPKGYSGIPLTKIPVKTSVKPVAKVSLSLPYTPSITLEQLELYWIDQALAYCDGNKSAAARLLGIGKATIYKKLQRSK